MISHLWWRSFDRKLQIRFGEPGSASEAVEQFRALTGYFTLGFLRYRTVSGSVADYPGAPSSNGARFDRMEGFARFAPVLAAWLAGGREDSIALPHGRTTSPSELLVTGFDAGTDPNSDGYWGELEDGQQSLVEAADLALALWLAREQVRPKLPSHVSERLTAWLRNGIDRDVIDNNWHLFPVLIWAVLSAMGEPHLPDRAAIRHYRRFKEFHVGDGWFRDGPSGPIDYYNAWQMHYALFWIGRILPSFDRAFQKEALENFVSTYRHMIGPRGFPIFGRSICYRMAAPCPIIAASMDGCDSVSPGLARRALNRTWVYFIRKGGVGRGAPTQGYGQADLRFLENYSGPASPLWSLRSLVLALYNPDGSRFWTDPEVPLPVENGSFEVQVPPSGWLLRGHQETGEIEVLGVGNRDASEVTISGYPFWRRALDRYRKLPSRPSNRQVKYDLGRYSSLTPFCGYGPP